MYVYFWNWYTVFFQFMFWFGPGLVSSPNSTEARRIIFAQDAPMLCFAVMANRPVSDLLENDCLQKSSLVRCACSPSTTSHFPSATLNDDATAAGGRDHRSNGANKSAACSWTVGKPFLSSVRETWWVVMYLWELPDVLLPYTIASWIISIEVFPTTEFCHHIEVLKG